MNAKPKDGQPDDPEDEGGYYPPPTKPNDAPPTNFPHLPPIK